ncbi:MAG: hypothetical protein AB8H86_34180 [Polyangiales bacterium]
MLRVLGALLMSVLPLSVSSAQEATQESDDPASAETPEREPAEWEGIWSLYGASLGRHLEGDGNGYSIGIELSDVHLYPRQLWYGYYADLRYSSLARGVDLSVGMEAGISVVGVDLGIYARIGGESAIGFRGRGCISALAVVSICAGGGYTNRGGFVEASLLLKYGRRRNIDGDEAEDAAASDAAASDADADAEARGDDEASARAVESPVADERMFVLEAPFQEGVYSTEPSSEAEDEAAAEDGPVSSDGIAAEDEAAPDVLDAEAGADPEVVEPAEINAVEQR